MGVRNVRPIVIVLVLFGLLLIFSACSKKSQEATPTPVPLNFEQAKQVHNQHQARPVDQAHPILKSVDVQGNQQCRQLCKRTCLRARQCKVPGFANLRRCAKFCLTACNNNRINADFEKCITPETKCKKVVKCLKQLRGHIRETRSEQNQAAPPPSGPAPATQP